jgi:flavin reductase (DIM6/NTAB) family NADH-FMN oxidoreductase RutF
LLCGVVLPRPIALDQSGKVDAAPFSFFNVFSEDPPLAATCRVSNAMGYPPLETSR